MTQKTGEYSLRIVPTDSEQLRISVRHLKTNAKFVGLFDHQICGGVFTHEEFTDSVTKLFKDALSETNDHVKLQWDPRSGDAGSTFMHVRISLDVYKGNWRHFNFQLNSTDNFKDRDDDSKEGRYMTTFQISPTSRSATSGLVPSPYTVVRHVDAVPPALASNSNRTPGGSLKRSVDDGPYVCVKTGQATPPASAALLRASGSEMATPSPLSMGHYTRIGCGEVTPPGVSKNHGSGHHGGRATSIYGQLSESSVTPPATAAYHPKGYMGAEFKREDTKATLQRHKDNGKYYYLVRNSHNEKELIGGKVNPNLFVVSYIQGNLKLVHHKIFRTEKGFAGKNHGKREPSKTIEEYVETYIPDALYPVSK